MERKRERKRKRKKSERQEIIPRGVEESKKEIGGTKTEWPGTKTGAKDKKEPKGPDCELPSANQQAVVKGGAAIHFLVLPEVASAGRRLASLTCCPCWSRASDS